MSAYRCTSLEQLDALDGTEMVEGYMDGFRNEPEPGPNRSPSYHHGWWTGAADGKHRPTPDWIPPVARLLVQRQRDQRPARRTA